MSPEVLQEKFLDWQCQSRIQAFRTQNGRPNSSMSPILIDKKGKIIKIWENVKVKDHAKEVLETLKIFTNK